MYIEDKTNTKSHEKEQVVERDDEGRVDTRSYKPPLAPTPGAPLLRIRLMR